MVLKKLYLSNLEDLTGCFSEKSKLIGFICESSPRAHHELVRLMLEKGADVDTQHDRGLTALHCASKNGHEAVARLPLEKGADV